MAVDFSRILPIEAELFNCFRKLRKVNWFADITIYPAEIRTRRPSLLLLGSAEKGTNDRQATGTGPDEATRRRRNTSRPGTVVSNFKSSSIRAGKPDSSRPTYWP